MTEEKLSYEELEKRFNLYRKIITHILADRSGVFFICGEGGEKDYLGLPQYIHVCPTYGSDIVQRYTKYQKDGEASAS
jgi:hypothetical protein